MRLTLSEADRYDAVLDHMVDTRGISYDDARRELGPPPYELYEVPDTPTTRPLGYVAARVVVSYYVGPQYGEEEGVGYPNGKPPYYQPYEPLSADQIATNREGLMAIRRMLAAGKESVHK